MAITIPDTNLVRPIHDIQQIQGALDGNGMAQPGPLSVVAGTNRPDSLPLFAPTTVETVKSYMGFGVLEPNTDDGAVSVLFNSVIAGFSGVVAGKKVYVGSGDMLTQDVALIDAPDATPTLTEGSAGALGAGTYKVAGAFVDDDGNVSALGVVSSVTITASKKIHVADFEQPLPDGVASINWYLSVAAGSNTLKFIANNSGAAFDINALPGGSAALPLSSVALADADAIGMGMRNELIFFYGAK